MQSLWKLTNLLKTSLVTSLVRHRAMSDTAGPKMHAMIEPLSWLLGKWRSEEGAGSYPTIKSFKYIEEVEFFHVGQPNIQFANYAFKSDTKAPMHRETGFIRIKPDSKHVAMIIAQNTGICSIEEGEINGKELNTTSNSISRMSFSKPPKATKVTRHFKRVDDTTLKQTLCLETENTKLTKHLEITYKKV